MRSDKEYEMTKSPSVVLRPIVSFSLLAGSEVNSTVRILNIMDMPKLAATGMPIAVSNLVLQQTDQGHEVVVLLYGSNVHSDPYLASFICKTIVASSFGNFVKTLRDLEKTIDVIHIHGLWSVSAISPLFLMGSSHTNVRLSFHGALAPAALQYGRLKKFLFWFGLQSHALSRVNDLIVTSKHEADGARKILPARNFIIEPLILPDIKPVPLPRNEPKRILYFGRLHPIKGLTRLLEAWATIQSRLPAWELHLTGPDDAQWGAFYRKLAAELSLERISFNEPVPAHMRLAALSEAHLVVAPSQTENFGLTIAEALALGRCVVASTATGWQPQQGLFLLNETEDLGDIIVKAANHVQKAL
jgi:glycosyltransferase involved in cell wall biosynthesis